eukprot:9554167-Karenia_brevis.AAC.1
MLGVINEAGHLGVVALILTSDMSVRHLQEAFDAVGRAAHELTGRPSTKKYSMSDAESAYRDGM